MPGSQGTGPVVSSAVPRTVLITGGAGFIGCSLSQRLLDTGDRVVAMDALHPQVHTGHGRPDQLPADVELLTADVTSPTNWDTVLRLVRPDAVVHLAAETGTGQSLSQASRHGLVNVVGTTQLMDALYASSHRPEHIVLASSRAVYGEGAWRAEDGTVFYPSARRHEDLVARRWDPPGPNGGAAVPLPHRAATTAAIPSNVYAATKLAQEHLLRSWGAGTGVDVSVLRLQNVYGPGQALANPYTGVVALFGRLAVAGAMIEVYEDGEILRDFVYVEDVTAALTAALDRPRHDGRLLDVGLGARTTILDVARTVAKLAGAPEPVVSGAFRDGDVRAASCDTTDAREQLDWRPEWPLERGLTALLDWVDMQPAP